MIRLAVLASLVISVVSLALTSTASAKSCGPVHIESTLKTYAFPLLFYPNGFVTFQGAERHHSIFRYVTNPMGMARDINEIPTFACHGLALHPAHLRYVETFDDLIQVVAWGLRQASMGSARTSSCRDLKNRYLAAKKAHTKLSRAASSMNDAEVLERTVRRMREQTSRMTAAAHSMRNNGCALTGLRGE